MNNLKRSLLLVMYKDIVPSTSKFDDVAKLEQFINEVESKRLPLFKLALESIYVLVYIRFLLLFGRNLNSVLSDEIIPFCLGLRTSRLSFFNDYYQYLYSFVTLYHRAENKNESCCNR